jgi:hypothetical protein
MKYRLQLVPVNLLGGKWAWRLRRLYRGGWDILVAQYGFDTKEEARRAWKDFKKGVNSVKPQEVLIPRKENQCLGK